MTTDRMGRLARRFLLATALAGGLGGLAACESPRPVATVTPAAPEPPPSLNPPRRPNRCPPRGLHNRQATRRNGSPLA